MISWRTLLYGDAIITRGFINFSSWTRASVRRLNFNIFPDPPVHDLPVTELHPIRVSGEMCFVSSRPVHSHIALIIVLCSVRNKYRQAAGHSLLTTNEIYIK